MLPSRRLQLDRYLYLHGDNVNEVSVLFTGGSSGGTERYMEIADKRAATKLTRIAEQRTGGFHGKSLFRHQLRSFLTSSVKYDGVEDMLCVCNLSTDFLKFRLM